MPEPQSAPPAHRGYRGTMEFDADAGVYRGRVLLPHDVVTFQGATEAGAGVEFARSVDEYLEFCEERGETPEEPDHER